MPGSYAADVEAFLFRRINFFERSVLIGMQKTESFHAIKGVTMLLIQTLNCWCCEMSAVVFKILVIITDKNPFIAYKGLSDTGSKRYLP